MEFESLVRRSSLTQKTLRGMLAVTVVLATAFLAAPGWAQTAPAPAPAAAPAATAPATTADEAGMSPTALRNVVIVIALFVVPILLGNMLAKSLKMPDHGWKFALAIGTLAAAAVVVALGESKLGPDLSGGLTRLYEVEKREGAEPAGEPVDAPPLNEKEMAAEDAELEEEGAEEVAEDEKDPAAEKEGFAGLNRSDTMAALIKALIERVDPSGTKQVSSKRFVDE